MSMSLRVTWISLLLPLWLALGCSGPSAEDDVATGDGPAGTDGGTVDQRTPDAPPLTSFKVAAVQYSEGQAGQVGDCTTDICALGQLAQEAAENGALLVVTPEGVTEQSTSEPAPEVGDAPVTDARWKAGSIIKSYAQVADELGIILVFNLVTKKDDKRYNTSVAVDGTGKVVARHFKFQLFGGEASAYTPGPSVESSFFDTPAGKMGLLICADVQCMITKMQVYDPDCTSHAVKLLKEFFTEHHPDAVLFSAMWSIPASSSTWGSIPVQKTVAKMGQVWLVGSNNTAGSGRGGGIFKPDGTELEVVESSTPTIVYGELPLKKK